MHLDSARELKQKLIEELVLGLATHQIFPPRAEGKAAALLPRPLPLPRILALGLSRRTRREYSLAVRLQSHSLLAHGFLAHVETAARREIDLRFVGAIDTQAAPPWTQRRHRPLRAGISVGHHNITAGTLGAFVTAGRSEAPFLLSNNHVLADEGRARPGDPILQPGAHDGGQVPEDQVAVLERFVRLRRGRPNLVDAAIARVDEGVEVTPLQYHRLGRLAGQREAPLDVGDAVAKLGRTTGVTRGRVTAIELDNVVVGFSQGNLAFDDQIEIEGEGTKAFSAGGDSGSLILDQELRAAGLLFAGSETGGGNGKGLTYVNPIAPVLSALKVRLLL